MAGRLTTHVLDTTHGRPAVGMRLVLARLHGGTAMPLVEAVTNADGRCDAPLLEGGGLLAGVYEIAFHVGDYFRAMDAAGEAPAFLDVVPVRFGIADPTRPHHVPLLVSPYGYVTYRGS